MIQLSADQQGAHDHIEAWWISRPSGVTQIKTLGGLAGTGKTTIMGAVANTLRQLYANAKAKGKLRIGFCCYTGKAASVLRRKLEAAKALQDQDHCGTIHSLIYEPIYKDGKVTGWKRIPKEMLGIDIFFLDEASMVDEKICEDLKSYGRPILAVGDHGQLPPIAGQLNLVANPEIRLEKIHRQAEGNPIIKLSMMVREIGRVPPGNYGEFANKVQDRDVLERVADPGDMMVIVGTNRTRTKLNQVIRRRLGFTQPTPQPGEKVICLRNNAEAGIFNGMTGVIVEIREFNELSFDAKIAMEGCPALYSGLISRPQFGEAKTLQEVETKHWGKVDAWQLGDAFDWGYAMTCHKAQGSEARRVVVFEECSWMETEDLRRRWLYTAYTRSSERLLIVGN